MSPLLRKLIPCLLPLAVTSCATSPASVLIALPPAVVRSVSPANPSLSAGRVVLVRRLLIPEYMAARRIRFWAAPATLGEWPDSVWAERIEIAMARSFVTALRSRLPGWSVCNGSCTEDPPDRTLSVELVRLDALRPQLRLVASVHGQVTTSPSDKHANCSFPAWTSNLDLPLSSDSAQGEAIALRDLLEVVADQAATALARSDPTGLCQ